jgi:hypothetical protein
MLELFERLIVFEFFLPPLPELVAGRNRKRQAGCAKAKDFFGWQAPPNSVRLQTVGREKVLIEKHDTMVRVIHAEAMRHRAERNLMHGKQPFQLLASRATGYYRLRLSHYAARSPPGAFSRTPPYRLP